MNKPSIFDIIIIIILLLLGRYYILTYNDKLLINGYFAIYIIVFFITYYLTRNAKFSVILSLIIVLGRIIYRKHASQKELENPNSNYHLITFIFGLIIVFIIIYNYNKILKYINYFPYIISILIVLILYCLKYKKTYTCLP